MGSVTSYRLTPVKPGVSSAMQQVLLASFAASPGQSHSWRCRGDSQAWVGPPGRSTPCPRADFSARRLRFVDFFSLAHASRSVGLSLSPFCDFFQLFWSVKIPNSKFSDKSSGSSWAVRKALSSSKASVHCWPQRWPWHFKLVVCPTEALEMSRGTKGLVQHRGPGFGNLWQILQLLTGRPRAAHKAGQ